MGVLFKLAQSLYGEGMHPSSIDRVLSREGLPAQRQVEGGDACDIQTLATPGGVWTYCLAHAWQRLNAEPLTVCPKGR